MPVQLGYLLYPTRRTTGSWSAASVVPYRAPLRPRTYVLLSIGVVGPIVEELYFRGHLLPAIDRLGVWAVVLNTVLFSLYHFWTPWVILERIGGLVALTYAVWRTRNVYIGVVVHVALNTIGMVLLIVAAV